MKSIIGLTMGDPAGIGPEIILKSLSQLSKKKNLNLVIFGDRFHLKTLQKKLRIGSALNKANIFSPLDYQKAVTKNLSKLSLVDFQNLKRKKISAGKVAFLAGKVAGDYIHYSINAALKGRIDAVVTAPIQKESFLKGGWGRKYVGHTEMFGKLTKSKRFASMVLFGKLRTLAVTYHVPLKNVSRKLNKKNIVERAELLEGGLKQLGIHRPKIAVCGLNPHSGDNGILGHEENKVIGPAVQRLKRNRIRVEGPIPSDVVWPQVLSGAYDAGLAMYHDQAQIPIKLFSTTVSKYNRVQRGVLITLGLPFIRTSPFHGSAYDIAGKGKASPQGMTEAILLTHKMVQHRKK